MVLVPIQCASDLASGAEWFYDMHTHSSVNSLQPFTSISIENTTYQPISLYINGQLQMNMNGYSFKTLNLVDQPVDSFTVKNTGVATLDHTKLLLTIGTQGSIANAISIGLTTATDLDKILSVNETAQPLVAAGDPQRFATYAELKVASMGALIPGQQKIYHGSSLAKQLLNYASSYEYENIGKVYDLNGILINCDNPFGNLMNNPTTSGNITGFTGYADDGLFTLSYGTISSAGACSIVQTNLNKHAAVQYLNFSGGDTGRVYTINFATVLRYAGSISYFIQSHSTSHIYASGTYSAAAWATTNKSATFTTVNNETLDITVQMGDAQAGAQLWVLSTIANKGLIASEMPQVILSGGV